MVQTASRAPISHNMFIDLVIGYRSAKVLFAATWLGVFAHLADAPRTGSECADALGVDRRALGILLEALVALGFVERLLDKYAITEAARPYLIAGGPQSVVNNLKFQELIWPCWSDLVDVVKSGKPSRDLESLLAGTSQAFTQEYIRGMDNIAKLPAADVASRLAVHAPRRILDVGGGPGTYTRALLERLPDSEGTIFDLDTTLRVTKDILDASSMKSRVRLHSGNYLKDDFPGEFDLVLMSNITHDESFESNRLLIQKAHRALRSGGRLAIHDFVNDASRGADLFGALFSVHMLVYTNGGKAYSSEEYTQLLLEGGFARVERYAIASERNNASWLFVAERV